jgi:hypothetical protein
MVPTDVDAHAARGAGHRTHGRFQIEAVQVGHLDLGDLFDLLLRDLADLGLVRLGRALRQVHGALDQHRHRRRLGDEGERAVREIVITTGMIRPSWSLPDVLALNALQKSMMLTPCGPSAVPTGGAGVALPAGICSFT